MYKNRTTCRACNRSKLEEVFDLGIQPLANNFTFVSDAKAGHAPLKLMHCFYCTMTQLSVVVDPLLLYSNYCYVTSPSRTMQEHFGKLLDEIRLYGPVKTLLEVGSNDGRFLSYCCHAGVVRVAGIDPAENLQPASRPDSLSICGLFNKDTAKQAYDYLDGTDIIVARHVFGHIDDLSEFMQAVDVAAGSNTVLVIEVPYVRDMMSRLEFDTIYHEHLSYISVRSIQCLLDSTPFRLQKVFRFDIHGGAIALFIVRKGSPVPSDPSVARYVNEESFTPEDWRKFNNGSIRKMVELKDEVAKHETVCGFGASAKSTVWLNACGFSSKHLKFICDATPQKIGRQCPGTDIGIVPEFELLRQRPAAAVIFAWNFKDEIIRNHQDYVAAGGQFLIPGG